MSILKEINAEYSLERLMLKLKLQYFGHLMWRADSLEKTIWAQTICLGKFWEMVRDREAWLAAVRRAPKSWTWLSTWMTKTTTVCVCVCVCVCVLSHVNSMRPHGLQPTRLLCPWNSLGKNTGLGHHSLLQGIFQIRPQAQNRAAYTTPHITKLKSDYSLDSSRNGILNQVL